MPWANVAQLCEKAQLGTPWKGALRTGQSEDRYAERVQTFLRNFEYRNKKHSWLHDASWRLTGPYEGCPPNGVNKGNHPAVRIYYSPQVIRWMCKHRQGDTQTKDGMSDLPDGSMIIKEMINPDRTTLALVPGSQDLWIAAPPSGSWRWYDENFDGWTIMIKDAKASADGWYYAFFSRTREDGSGNPPLWDRSAFALTPYPGSDQKPVEKPPGAKWYPTFWNYGLNDIQYPNYQYGSYCVYCHASAQGQSTFSSFKNILGAELRYPWIQEVQHPVDHDEHARSTNTPKPFPRARSLNDPLPGFNETFPELKVSYDQVWSSRLPAQTWDHAVSKLGVKDSPDKASQYLSSDQCEGCHGASGAGQLARPNMVFQDRGQEVDLSAWAEWSTSPMGLAGRDPIFHAQLELERNIAREQPKLSKIMDCIDNTCLHCHGAAGARQYNIDTEGQGPKGDPCADFLPPAAQRSKTNYGGGLFTQHMVGAWRDQSPELARYGGLARNGINCTICHRISDEDLDAKNLPKTFTGNFRVGAADTIYGPFPNKDSQAAVLTKPMENALGITPKLGKQTASSQMCGTCHTIVLPVFGDQGQLAGTAYEQTTYLEWLLSDFATPDGFQSCQDCHMPDSFDKKPLTTGIANVLNSRYPKTDFLMPAQEVDNPKRPYRRHVLYGLNAFLNAYFQQFPLLLGYRQQDYMNPQVRAPLLTARESVLEIASQKTASLSLSEVARKRGTLSVTATIENLGGHNLPSGVGFRRVFVELLVVDQDERPLWASGRTNALGVILKGTSAEPLPTEFWQPGRDGLPFQPHHQVITAEDQVQIYEELTQNESLSFTSSFIHRYWEIKDNRLRPRGYSPRKVKSLAQQLEYGAATAPGQGPENRWWPKPKRKKRYKNPSYPAISSYSDTRNDPDYNLKAQPGGALKGQDTIRYEIKLSPELMAKAKQVRATLFFQATPPHYLQERFERASRKGAERAAADRLYYMAGHLNTEAQSDDGKPYLEGNRLQLDKVVERSIPAKTEP